MTRSRRTPNDGSETININLRKSESTDDVDEKTTTAYIISQNRKLAHENKLLIIEKVALEKEIDEKEDELGRTERSNVHMRGILKNFKRIADLHNKNSTSRELMVREVQSDMFEFLEEIRQMRNICFIGYIIYLSLMFFVMSWSNFIMTNISIAPCMATFFYLSSFKPSSSKTILGTIRQNKKEIKEIEESLDFINEYVDSI
tara:strand:+ start:70 stop:675 length:606 start_codon:yes stop_codon:yes gene_type:complete